jgi:hypothetical protein
LGEIRKTFGGDVAGGIIHEIWKRKARPAETKPIEEGYDGSYR